MGKAKSKILTRRGIAAAGLVVVGCAEGEPEPRVRSCDDPEIVSAYAGTRPALPLVRQTEHLDIYAQEGWFVCAGMASELERHVKFVAEQMGIDDLRTNIAYYYTYDLPKECSPTAAGCTMPDGASYGVPTTTYHELTHAVACQLRNNSTDTYTEGLATAFSQVRRGHKSYADTYDGDLLDLLAASPTDYSYAGHFVRWLVERGGGSEFATVYESSRGVPPMELDQLTSVLETVYDVGVGELFDGYVTEAPYAWVPFRQCADISHVDAQGDEWHIAGIMDCDDEATMGPYERPYELSAAHALQYMYQSVTFTVDAPGAFLVEISNADHVNFSRCAERHAESSEDELALFSTAVAFSVAGLPAESVDLTAGVWRADVMQLHSSPGPYEIVIRPDDGG